jgi:glycosyltransferase involved in cell wall biosynthesis
MRLIESVEKPNATPASTDDNSPIELSIVMPCLNEAETIETCIRKAQASLEENGIRGEVVIGDNGSTDGSQAIAEKLGARVVPVDVKGYGAALRGGITAARGKYVIMGDADDSYDFSNLAPFIEKLREGFDLVMGNRFKGGIQPGAMPPLHRYLGNPVLTGIGRLFFYSPAGDFHCGLRGFSKAAFDAMDLQTTGMEFASEMVVTSTLLKLKIAEVPTTLSPDGRSRPPHLRSWRDGWRHLRFMLMYSPRWLFLYPGLFMILTGFAVGLWLLPGPQTLNGVTFDVHTMLYASGLVFIGFQAVQFAMFTKVFAVTEGLLPEDPRLSRAFKYITLEVGLIVGALIFLAGVVGTGVAIADWRGANFGDLKPTHELRIIIPSTLALALGSQTMLASFFFSVLGLKRQ